MCSSHDVALYSTPTSDARLQEVIEATKKDNTAVTETNCCSQDGQKKEHKYRKKSKNTGTSGTKYPKQMV